jgi:hypothetical protein
MLEVHAALRQPWVYYRSRGAWGTRRPASGDACDRQLGGGARRGSLGPPPYLAVHNGAAEGTRRGSLMSAWAAFGDLSGQCRPVLSNGTVFSPCGPCRDAPRGPCTSAPDSDRPRMRRGAGELERGQIIPEGQLLQFCKP